MNVRLTKTTSRSERTSLDPTDDVCCELVSGEVVDETTCSCVVGADDGAQEGFNLMESSLESEDVSFGRTTLVARAYECMRE